MVVLHGLFGSLSNWKGIARTLAKQYRVVTVDLRNHGRSPWHDDVSYPAMAEDVVELFDSLQLETATLVGHSMGGKTAMVLALLHPHLVKSLVVVDIAPVNYRHSHVDLIRTLQSVDLGTLERRQDLDREIRGAIPDSGLRMFLSQNLIFRDGHFEWRINLRALASGMRSLTGFPNIDDKTYSGNTLLLYGEDSDYVKPEHELRVRKLFPGAKLKGIANAGHWVHAQKPDEIISGIQTTIDAVGTDV